MRRRTEMLPLLIALLLAAGTGSAQSRPDIPAFLVAAGDAGREMALLTPSVQQVNKSTAYLPLIGAARKLASRAQQAGAGMSAEQYETMQRELAKIETDLDNLLGTSGSACPKSCRDAFGNGYSGGKGWNRFVCKLGCIKINSSAGKTGG